MAATSGNRGHGRSYDSRFIVGAATTAISADRRGARSQGSGFSKSSYSCETL